jgi:hypothetical protein
MDNLISNRKLDLPKVVSVTTDGAGGVDGG